ncbi:MAG: hypothetical protein WA001_03400 [Patescibacteria group bacterium]
MRKFRLTLATIGFAAITLPSLALAATPVGPTLKTSAEDYTPTKGEFASALVIDLATGKQLYAYQPYIPWTGASLTKLMNALVFLDTKPNFSKTMTLLAKDEVGGARLRVNDGTKMTLGDMYYTTLMASTNNTAMALARETGLTLATYVNRMNAKAKALGMTHTTYVEPSGMDPANKTTASDLAILAKYAFNVYLVHKAATMMTYTFSMLNSNVVKKVSSTDELLVSDPDVYVYGGKTGFLYESMYNDIAEMEPNPRTPQGHKLLVVVLGSQTSAGSFAAVKSLGEWAWKSYSWN